MWQDKLKEIIYILENSNINEIEVNFWGRKYRVVKNANIMVQDESAPQIQSSNASPKEKNTPLEESEVSETVPPASLEGEELLSPMPGTFYSAPTPDDPKFVNVGDKVNKGQTLCIIEAMKIMNEIESEFEGTVTDIKVNNGEAVEYNQPLFIINPT
jgi:acetyl-CoA carboxylase biotin carboxyl carrier protein|tara:strand:+ start:105 stop:575 length:471 start_codon:yes stop_codon:yes gene_type:complete